MSNGVPILRRLITGEPFWDFDLDKDEDYLPDEVTRAFINTAISRATTFNIQVGADLFGINRKKLTKQSVFDIPIRLPFPSVWFEWIHHYSDEGDADCAMLIREVHDNSALEMLFIVTAHHGKNYLQRYAMTGLMELTPACTMDDYYIQLDRDGSKVSILDLGNQNRQLHVFNAAIVMCIYTLGLINCKNVHTEPTGNVPITRSGAEKRRGVPARKVKYHTIQLPGGGTQSDGKGGHRATAIHQVRGHFKTFTAERPLLGQHVGTYWWGWQVRGNAEKGIVVSDYNLEGARQ